MRCAAYQEDGYPAGRWRLATYAELEFIAMLCAKDALPYSLFGASDYWSATGALELVWTLTQKAVYVKSIEVVVE